MAAVSHIQDVSYTLAGLFAVWIAYIVIYRLYFSPLAKIPGPKLAALTTWYEFYYDVIQPGQYVFKIKQLHGKYGEYMSLHAK